MLRHQAQRIGERLVGMDGHRIDHHAGFELLDLADLVGLLGDVEVAVDDAEPAGLRHGDGQRLSVTVSMAAEISGMPSSMVEVSRVLVSVSFGRTAEAAGTSRTSSKVSA